MFNSNPLFRSDFGFPGVHLGIGNAQRMFGQVFRLPGSFNEQLGIYNAPMLAEYPAIPPRPMLYPLNTGSSVVGIKYKGGVMIAADTAISNGDLSQFNDEPRVFRINERILIAGSSDFADFQYIKKLIIGRIMEDEMNFDNYIIGPRSIYIWLRHVFYQRRCRLRPFCTELIIAGLNVDNTFFLGSINPIGAAYDSDIVCTSFGSHLVLPLMREKKPNDRSFTKNEASTLLRKCLEVLFYRDSRSNPTYMVGVCTKKSCKVLGPKDVDENWLVTNLANGY